MHRTPKSGTDAQVDSPDQSRHSVGPSHFVGAQAHEEVGGDATSTQASPEREGTTQWVFLGTVEVHACYILARKQTGMLDFLILIRGDAKRV